jgi:LmbE family N-acetylglucosaminyl deacetylase
MNWIFLSPHLDDIAFSCGGLVWEMVNQGASVEIWTICAGEPAESDLSPLAIKLHESWGLGLDAVRIRREEDLEACSNLGAEPRHFQYLDCIYRKSISGGFIYKNGSDIFGGLDQEEGDLITDLSRLLLDELPEEPNLVAPLGIGNHVDHQLTRKAANRLDLPLQFYADYPYAREREGQEILNFMASSGEWQSENYPISPEGLENWFLAANTYRSQISTFWEGEDVLRSEIEAFSERMGGVKLWNTVENH